MKRIVHVTSCVLIAFSLFLPVYGQVEDEGTNETDATENEVDEDDSTMEEMTVTGSRLYTEDPSARIDVITSEQIRARGLSTVEDVIRTIPQILSSINSQNNLEFGSDVVDENFGALALGISTANLKGFGSKNTLVLLNGKRMAGIAGSPNFFVNLREIPSNAIERVEVLLDGGSVLYGSDAVAGVINVITKTGYSGGSIFVRQELSNTDADQQSIGGYLGKAWDGGIATLNFSTTAALPVSYAKAGYTTRNHEAAFADSNYNFLSDFSLKSAGISRSRWGPFLTLGEGNDGRNAMVSDFRTPTTEDYADVVPQDAAGETDDYSVILTVQHTLFDKFTIQGEYIRTEHETVSRRTTFGVGSWTIPASNAFNPFGQTVYARYEPDTEIELGLIPPPRQTSSFVNERLIINLSYALDKNTVFDFVYNVAESSSTIHQIMFAPGEDRDIGNPRAAERIAELLASSDPNVAINLFGDGTGQNPTVSELVVPYQSDIKATEVGSIELAVRSNISDFGFGDMPIVIGYERRPEVFVSGFGESITGFEKPERVNDALFGEITYVLVDRDSARQGIQSLVFTFKARYDRHQDEGTNSTNEDGTPNIVNVTYSRTSPRLGVAWEINDDIELIGSWGQSFRAPSANELYLGSSQRIIENYGYDPLCGGFCAVGARLIYGAPNDDLRPEVADNYTLGLRWTPERYSGLHLQADLSMIDYRDRIASSNELSRLLPVEEYAYLTEFFTRDEQGNLLETRSKTVNISRRVNQTLDFQVSKIFNLADGGTLKPSLYWSFVIDMFDQAKEGSPKSRFLDESVGIDRYSLQGTVEWQANNKTFNVFVDFTPSYTNNNFENTFNERIDPYDVGSRTTVDMSGTYQMDNGILFRLGGRNIFDKAFPFVLETSGGHLDESRVDLRGRVLYFDVTYEFNLD